MGVKKTKDEMKKIQRSGGAPGMMHTIEMKGDDDDSLWEIYEEYCTDHNIYKSKRGSPEDLFKKMRSAGAGQWKNKYGIMEFTGVITVDHSDAQELLECGKAREFTGVSGQGEEDSNDKILNVKGDEEVVIREDETGNLDRKQQEIRDKQKKKKAEPKPDAAMDELAV